jgi:DNA-binding transcriptional LysR family regulator
MPMLTVERCRPSIRTGGVADLLRDLRSHEVDLVVGEGEPIEAARSGLEVVLIHRPVLVAVARPDIEPTADWRNLSLLECRTASVYYWEVDNFFRENGFHPTSMGELDDAFLMLEAVARGGFVAFVPAHLRHIASRPTSLGGPSSTDCSCRHAYAIGYVYLSI